jgi:hypothetical protein
VMALVGAVETAYVYRAALLPLTVGAQVRFRPLALSNGLPGLKRAVRQHRGLLGHAHMRGRRCPLSAKAAVSADMLWRL